MIVPLEPGWEGPFPVTDVDPSVGGGWKHPASGISVITTHEEGRGFISVCAWRATKQRATESECLWAIAQFTPEETTVAEVPTEVRAKGKTPVDPDVRIFMVLEWGKMKGVH